MKEYLRWQSTSVETALKKRRVVILSGARQCGKTTLINQVADSSPENFIFRTLDDKGLLKSALDDPITFVKHSKGAMIIDEVQKAPDIVPAVKQVVDKDNRYGQFLLTGSADITSLPEVSESLAGRVKNIRLRPLTNGEILGKMPSFIEKCFAKDFPVQIKGFDKETLIKQAFRGGYPEAVKMHPQDRKDWHKDYREALFKRDLKNIANISRQDVIRELFAILNSWSGKYMDLSNIGSNLAVSRITLGTYINALKTLFLFESVKPWLKTDYDRVGKKDKIYSTDTGIMTSSLDWKESDVLLDSDKSGKLIETLVFNELAAQIDFADRYALYQYRDRAKREIDFIIEDSSGALTAIEVKSSAVADSSDFKHIRWFKENVADNKKFTGVVLYSGENTISFRNNMYAVPLACLWE
ncbi:MAG: ATP-binding protein [Endomicrobia bacterium]|nr:ATP-binding protein [Endomicrobiia bacterium]